MQSDGLLVCFVDSTGEQPVYRLFLCDAASCAGRAASRFSLRTAVAPSGLLGLGVTSIPGLAKSASPGLHSAAPSGQKPGTRRPPMSSDKTCHTWPARPAQRAGRTAFRPQEWDALFPRASASGLRSPGLESPD